MMIRRFSFERFFNSESNLAIWRKQFEACRRSANAIFSHYNCKQYEAGKPDFITGEVKDDKYHVSSSKSDVPVSTDSKKDSSEQNWISQLTWLNNVLKPVLEFYRRILPPGISNHGPSPASTQSLVEIATNLQRSAFAVGMQEWSLGDLTLGLYLLSLHHASEMAVDNIEGEQIFSDVMVQDLIYHVELAKGAYLKGAAAVARSTMLRESNVLKFVSNSNVMRPGYYIGVDPRKNLVILGIRGTHNLHDFITDIVLSSQEASFDGFFAHFGTTQAARWFFHNELQTLRECLEKHKGSRLRLVGHSLGGAAAALLALMIRRKSQKELGFDPDIVSAVGFATPPCVSEKLAEDCREFVSTVVLQDDAIPRVSAKSLAGLRNEILLTDWLCWLYMLFRRNTKDFQTSLVILDRACIPIGCSRNIVGQFQTTQWLDYLIQYIMSRANTLKFMHILFNRRTRLLAREKGKAVADLVTNTIQALSSMQDVARKYAAYARLRNNSEGDQDGSNAKDRNSNSQLIDTSLKSVVMDPIDSKDVGAKHHQLYLPGTLFHIRGRCVTSSEKETITKENCSLWKGYPKEHFKRIVLSRTVLSDHKCDSHYYALRDVLKGLPLSNDKSLT